MAKEAADMQMACMQSQEPLDIGEALFFRKPEIVDSPCWISFSIHYCLTLTQWELKGIPQGY